MFHFNMDYIDETPNKTPRQASQNKIKGIVWHETASNNPDNPIGTLEYNKKPEAQSSYNYLVARDGTIYFYVDESMYIAWHAGKKNKWEHSEITFPDGSYYRGLDVNAVTIGIELDGRNNGEPSTKAQYDSAVYLGIYLCDKWGIPATREYHFTHAELTTQNYKSDPRCVNLDELVEDIRNRIVYESPVIGFNMGYAMLLITATVRSGPSRNYPTLDYRKHGTPKKIVLAMRGERVSGSDVWYLLDGIGFVHSSGVRVEE